MAATAIRIRPNRTEIAQWNAIFPMDVMKNTTSIAFMKKLSLVGLSAIAYNRNFFENSSYDSFNLSNLDIKILKEKSGYEPANLFYERIMAAADAIEKKYLRVLELQIFKDDDFLQPCLESYKITYKYNISKIAVEKKVTKYSSRYTINTVRKATQDYLLNYCKFLCCENLKTLPDNFHIKINLGYYDEVTPKTYHPIFYLPWQVLNADVKEDLINLGTVSTNHHKFKFYFNQSGHNSIGENNSQISEKMKDEVFEEINDEIESYNEGLTDANIEQFRSLDLSQDSNASLFTAINPRLPDKCSKNTTHSTDDEVRCPCDTSIETYMLKCRCCKYWQHGACFGVLHEDAKKCKMHYCDICTLDNSVYKCTDSKLLEMDSKQKSELCLLRNALVFCSEYNQVDAAKFMSLFKITRSKAINLMNKLDKCQVFYPASTSKTIRLSQMHIVNMYYLKNKVIPEYFGNDNKPSNDNQVKKNKSDELFKVPTTKPKRSSASVMIGKKNIKRRKCDYQCKDFNLL